MRLRKIIGMLVVICSVAVMAGCGGGQQQQAQKKPDFPKKEITIVVPWNAGGGIDMMARKIQVLFKDMGITAVVKNVPGGNGVMGINEVMTSKPDGYTVGVQTSSTLAVMALGKSQIKADKLTNIALMADDPHVLVVSKDAPWKTLKELIDYMKANPNAVSLATVGTNNVNHAVPAMMGQVTGTEFKHVPFDGAALVIPAILGGHVNAAILKPSEAVQHVKEGKFRALAINGERMDVLPGVPTFIESGVDLWKGAPLKQMSILVAPAGLDPAVRDKLIEIFNKATQSPDYQKLAKESGFIADKRSPEQLDKDTNALLKSEVFSKIFQ